MDKFEGSSVFLAEGRVLTMQDPATFAQARAVTKLKEDQQWIPFQKASFKPSKSTTILFEQEEPGTCEIPQSAWTVKASACNP